jgi:hypothetical protein
MAQGGRYFVDSKGKARRADPGKDEHHEYPVAKPADGKAHPASLPGAEGHEDQSETHAAPAAPAVSDKGDK